jgi:hypothetical protein
MTFRPSRSGRRGACALALLAALALAPPAVGQDAVGQDAAGQDAAGQNAAGQDADSDARTPLFAHTDQGRVNVMHGASGARLPLAEARREVRGYIARVDALLAAGDAAATARVEAARQDGRALQEQLDTGLVGTLYLEEALRRLTRLRLARIPVAETQVVRRHRDAAPARFDKRVVLRRGADDLGVDYATLAACLERADFPNDAGPRRVNVEDDGALWTRIAGRPFALDLVPFRDQRLLLRSVVLGGTRSMGFKEKHQVARLILDNCL